MYGKFFGIRIAKLVERHRLAEWRGTQGYFEKLNKVYLGWHFGLNFFRGVLFLKNPPSLPPPRVRDRGESLTGDTGVF